MAPKAKTVKATKPVCKLTGADGNIFGLVGKAVKVLKRAGQDAEAKQLADKVRQSGSYSEALGIIDAFVDVE